jgi:hypothetical protein
VVIPFCYLDANQFKSVTYQKATVIVGVLCFGQQFPPLYRVEVIFRCKPNEPYVIHDIPMQ